MQQGGSPYGALPSQPQMQQSSELPTSFQGMAMAEAAPPITSLPPPPPPPLSSSSAPTFEELATGDDPLEGGSGGSGGNRWPRQETLALLKIRSDMDAAFKDATLKGPLWEDVSRKLAELGYKRNAKKCKEKFENVHKYYKRTKEGRAGRQDGKSYRFFSQLEALHSSTVSSSSPRPLPITLNPPPMTTNTNTSASIPRPIQPQNPATSAPMPITSVPPPPPIQLSSVPSSNMISHNVQYPSTAKPGGFSSNTSSSSSGSESDDEQTEDLPMSGKKRKREGESGSRKMMAFFEGLMRQVMERQETMQKKFLEAIEKREQDRMIREEAWRRQEITRMAREHELAAQERAAAASRDAAIISFLQKVTGQTVQIPSPNTTVSNQLPPPSQTPPPQPPPQPSQVHQQTPVSLPPQQTPPPQQPPPPPQQQQQQQQQRSQDIVLHQYQTTPPANTEMTTMQVMEEGSGGMSGPSMDPTSSRWPKAEVHALIQLRSGLDSRYQETGPKGPLWEEISAGMRRLGYNRNAKRCKEKWENINKYFKKVKESNKQRPEDAKTCPYFHQLDALYRSKHNTSGSGGGSSMLQLTHPNPNPNPNPNHNQNQNPNPNPNPSPISMMAPPQLVGDNDETNGGARTNFFRQTTTGGGDEGGIMKKPEDIVRELMEQTNNNNEYGNDPESDNMDEDDEDDEDGEDDEEEEGNGQYRIQFQRQNNVSNSNNNGGGNGTTPTQNTSGNSTGSFLAMVR